MNLHLSGLHAQSRRQFLHDAGRFSLGAVALQSLLGHAAAATEHANPLAVKQPPNPAKAKAVIYLSMSGAPPSLDMFDWKPELAANNMKECPDKFLKGEKFAFIKGTPKL